MPGENAHNALQDTKNALTLFQKIIEKIENLQTKYPIVSHFTSQEIFSLAAYLPAKGPTLNNDIKDIPRLNKIMGANTQSQANESTIDL
ncbi:TPA: hypothetical protein DIC40_07375 [Patescibacteria group bacterium]|nr:hypothetical protein [Candidatus Gracilibacteria bacterium]